MKCLPKQESRSTTGQWGTGTHGGAEGRKLRLGATFLQADKFPTNLVGFVDRLLSTVLGYL